MDPFYLVLASGGLLVAVLYLYGKIQDGKQQQQREKQNDHNPW